MRSQLYQNVPLTELRAQKPDFNYSLNFEPDSSDDDDADFKVPALPTGLAEKLQRIQNENLNYSLNFDEDDEEDDTVQNKPVVR